MARQGKRRCDFCRADSAVWLWYTTRSYPSGRVQRANAAACVEHESCAGFSGLLHVYRDSQPELIRARRTAEGSE